MALKCNALACRRLLGHDIIKTKNAQPNYYTYILALSVYYVLRTSSIAYTTGNRDGNDSYRATMRSGMDAKLLQLL